MESKACEVVIEDCMLSEVDSEMAVVVEQAGEGVPPGISREEETVVRIARETSSDWKVAGRELCKRFGYLIQSQKDKKRITIVVSAELEEIRDRYELVLDRMWEENARLEGQLEENRRHLREVMAAGSTEKSAVVEVGTSKKSAVLEKAGSAAARNVVKVIQGRGEEAPKLVKGKGNALGKEVRKEARIEVRQEARTEVRKAGGVSIAQGNGKDEGDFTEVTRKKKEKKVVEERKRESWRAKEPPKSFIIPAGEGGVEAAKKKTWAEIAGKIGAPQITKMVIMPRGDIRVFPGNDRTTKALREIENEGKIGAKEARQRWPKVIVYDVERTISAEELPSAIGLQNPEFEVAKGKEGEVFKPIFQWGPKVSEEGNRERDKVTSWVCEVCPALFNRLAGRYVYLGFGRCKVSEWREVLQCKGCQGFGHMEVKCSRKRLICGYCAKEGHRKAECKDKEGPPKCFNCGKQFQAAHEGCEVRKRVARATMERTCYGNK